MLCCPNRKLMALLSVQTANYLSGISLTTLIANLLVILQPFKQRFRRPKMPIFVPVKVALKFRILGIRAYADDVFALVDDGDVKLLCHCF